MSIIVNKETEVSKAGETLKTESVVMGRQDIVASLENTSQAMRAPQVVEYYSMQPLYGDAAEGVAQGEYNIQFLGSVMPKELQQLPRNVILNSESSQDVQIGQSSHYAYLDNGGVVWNSGIENPLVMLYAYVPEGSTLLIKHDEHAWPRFHSPGYYVVRAAREGSLTDSMVAQAVARRVD